MDKARISRLLTCLLLVAFLLGCNQDHTHSPQFPLGTNPPQLNDSGNTLPELGGVHSNRVLAEEETVFVFPIIDPDDDTISVNLDSPPDWLRYESTNDVLTVTVSPDFFDIGNYRMDLTLDDGNDTRSYVFELAVDDNPAKYRNIRITRSDLIGLHVFQSRDLIYLFDNGKGLYANKFGEQYQVRWQLNRRGEARVQFYDLDCFSCGLFREYTLSIVAEQSQRQRWLLTPPIGDIIVSNTIEVEPQGMPSGEYLSFATNVGVLARVDASQFVIPARVSTGDEEVDVVFQGEFDEEHLNATFPDEKTREPLYGSYLKTFFNEKHGAFLGLRFDLFAHSIDVTFSNEHITQLEVAVIPALSSENQDVELDDYDVSLAKYLETPIQRTVIFEPLKRIEIGRFFEAGNTYYSGFDATSDVVISGTQVSQIGATKLRLFAQGEAQLDVKTAGLPDYVAMQNAVWEVSANQLLVTDAEKTRAYEMYENSQGQLLLSGARQQTPFTHVYPLIRVVESAPPELPVASSLAGTFKMVSSEDYFSADERFFVMKDNRLAFGVRIAQTVKEDRLQIEADDSIEVVAGQGQCRSFSIGYSFCRQLHEFWFLNRGYEYQLKRLQLVHVDEDYYYFTTHRAQMDSRKPDASRADSSFLVLKRIDN
ncbi:hypothetical protein [Alteromonas sp. a30]|uniref:hypothetical protein n=1 Tax=Alteromonas sp. a30 TaxID=2730917 RepID=UPI0022800A27|nr:hypothetical protein [Alteromonas sp. a30]MCY7296807.1 hypothetical protein [Alteromonas sp. a30]